MITNPEKQLVERIIQKDRRALLAVYKTYKKSILFFVRRQINDSARAEEIVQDVFYDFIEHIRDFRGESSIKTFLFSIARHKVIDEIRKKKIKKVLFSALPTYVVEGLERVFIDDEVEKHELAERIERAFKKLPNDYELVLRLKYVEGSRVNAIARRLRMSFKATESLLYRARRAFIKKYETTRNHAKT